MTRQEIIETLVKCGLARKPNSTEKEIQEYREYLATKTDVELQNILVINC